jgi:hypothetical protein
MRLLRCPHPMALAWLRAVMRAATMALRLGRPTTGSRRSISFAQGVDDNS